MDQDSLSDLRRCAMAMVQMNLTSDQEIITLAKTYNLVYKFLQKMMDSILPKGNLNLAMRLVDQLNLTGTVIHFKPDLQPEDSSLSLIGTLNFP
jgi:DNA polymerase II large subunit